MIGLIDEDILILVLLFENVAEKELRELLLGVVLLSRGRRRATRVTGSHCYNLLIITLLTGLITLCSMDFRKSSITHPSCIRLDSSLEP